MKITSAQNNLIKELALLKNKKERDEKQMFLIDDLDLIKDAYKRKVLLKILTSKLDSLPFGLEGIEIIETTDKIIQKLADVKTASGFIGVCEYFINELDYNDESFIALDSLQDPGNGGAIVRTAEALNFKNVILSNEGFDVYNAKFIRATKGSFFKMNIKRINLEEKILTLKNKGYKIIVTSLSKKAYYIDSLRIEKPFVLVFGNEGNGVSDTIVKMADYLVKIPINENVESLNVAVASAIVMYVLSREE